MAWLSKMWQSLSTSFDSREAVREAIRQAQRERVKFTLVASAADEPVVMNTTIEQVRDDDIVVSQPTIGGLTRQLTYGEELKLSFIHHDRYYVGRTRCQGRIQVASGGAEPDHKVLFAYSIALPNTLDVQERRREPRVQIGFDLSPVAHLTAAVDDVSVQGTIVDLSVSGALVRTPKMAKGLTPGAEFSLRTELPDPAGKVNVPVKVARVAYEPKSSQYSVGVQFLKPVEGMEELIQQLMWVRDQRRRAG